MYPLFHTILIEPDAERAQTFGSMFTALGAVVTHAPGAARASRLLSSLLPDLLVVGLHSASIRSLYPWLPGVLAATPLRTLLYAEHAALLDTVALALPLLVTTVLWPCSPSELTFLLAPLVAGPAYGPSQLQTLQQTAPRRAGSLLTERRQRLVS